MALLITIIVFIILSIVEINDDTNRRKQALNKRSHVYWNNKDKCLKNPKNNASIDIFKEQEKKFAKLRMEKYLIHKNMYGSYEDFLKKEYPNMWKEILVEDLIYLQMEEDVDE